MNAIKFTGNDYLGLASDSRLTEAMYKAAKEHGVSSTSSRCLLGWSDVHRQLEQDLTTFFGTQSACLIPSTCLGGLLYFTTMADRHKVVYCDEYSHPNLFLGMRAAGMQIRRYRHLDTHDLAKQLSLHFDAPPIVCTDGIFDISGELAPVEEIAALVRRFKTELFIDDSHGVFVMGRNGRGVAELAKLDLNTVTVLGSMSRALGCGSGFLVGNAPLMERLQRAPTGNSPAPIPLAAACREAIRIVSTEPERRHQVSQNSRRMREIMARHNVAMLCDSTPIVTLFLKDDEEARNLETHLNAHGLLVRYIKSPSDPRQNLLQLSALASHTAEDLTRFEAAVHTFFGKGKAHASKPLEEKKGKAGRSPRQPDPAGRRAPTHPTGKRKK